MLNPGLNIVLDGQWGSTGKGKLCGRLGQSQPDVVCSSFGPNAGHTFLDDNGRSTVYKCLPSSAITARNSVPVLILPDSAIKVERLMEEIKTIDNPVFVHPRTAVVTDADMDSARVTGKHLAGTMQGTGHAISRKLLRIKGTKLAKDVLPASMIEDTSDIIQNAVHRGDRVLVEVSQGFDLSLNHGLEYPYLTSRDITVGSALNACGCTHKDVGQVIGSIRVHPIRVGNVDGGWSGPHHPDQVEITWDEVTAVSKSPERLEEKTTVTKRVRRVFSFSLIQVQRFVRYCQPDWFFVNFIQYMGWKMHRKREWAELTEQAQSFITNLELKTGVPVKLIGTGAANSDVVEAWRR